MGKIPFFINSRASLGGDGRNRASLSIQFVHTLFNVQLTVNDCTHHILRLCEQYSNVYSLLAPNFLGGTTPIFTAYC